MAALRSAPDALTPPTRERWGAFALALGVQFLVVLALVRAFTPDLPGRMARAGLAAINVHLEPPPPPPAPPAPHPRAAARPSGATGLAGRQAVPRAVAAPVAKIILSPLPAPPVASTGAADTSGATASGAGTGAGSTGQGSGEGGNGSGQGGGGGKAVKIAGDINSARDYPAASRDLRINDYVIVAITVGVDGRPTACRVHRPSADAAANAITCQLAMARFRFRPATDASGRPVEAVYGWMQKWHY